MNAASPGQRGFRTKQKPVGMRRLELGGKWCGSTSWPEAAALRLAQCVVLAALLGLAAELGNHVSSAAEGAAAEPRRIESTNTLVFIDTSFENASPLWYEFLQDRTVLV